MDVTLAVEDDNVKLVDIVEVAGFGIEESIDFGLVKLIAWRQLDNSFSQFVTVGVSIEFLAN